MTSIADSTPAGSPVAVPRRVMLLIGLLTLAGALSIAASVWLAIGGAQVMTHGSVGLAVGAFILVLAVVPAGAGVCFLLLARSLREADQVARILTIGGCLCFAFAVLLSGSRDAVSTISALLALGAAALLIFDPVVREFFDRPNGGEQQQPVPVVAARTLLAIAAAIEGLVGLMFLPEVVFLGTVVLLWGLLFIAIGAALYVATRQLGRGSRSARIAITAIAVVYIVSAIVAGHGQPGVILPVGLTLFVVGLLWLPHSSQDYFDTLLAPATPAVALADDVLSRWIRSMTPTSERPSSTTEGPGA